MASSGSRANMASTREEDIREDVKTIANRLVRFLGLRGMEFSSFEEVVSSASSMLVSMFEAIFDVTLKEVIRTPSRRQDYVANAQTVVKACQELIKVSLPITGEQICQGDANAIRHMLILMIDTGFLIKSDASHKATHSTESQGDTTFSNDSSPVYKSHMQETTDSEAFSDRDSPSHDNQSLHRSKSHHDLPIISDFDFDQVSSERHSYSISSTVEFPNTDRNPQVNPLLRSSFPTLERIKAQHQINSKYKNREKRVQAKKNLLEMKHRASLQHCAYNQAMKEHLHEMHLARQKHISRVQQEVKLFKRHRKRERMLTCRLEQDLAQLVTSRRMKQLHKEERLVHQFFKEAIRLEKERKIDEHKASIELEASMKRELENRQNLADTFHQDRLNMIKEQIKKERKERELLMNAGSQAVHDLEKQLFGQRLHDLEKLRSTMEQEEQLYEAILDPEQVIHLMRSTSVRGTASTGGASVLASQLRHSASTPFRPRSRGQLSSNCTHKRPISKLKSQRLARSQSHSPSDAFRKQSFSSLGVSRNSHSQKKTPSRAGRQIIWPQEYP